MEPTAGEFLLLLPLMKSFRPLLFLILTSVTVLGDPPQPTAPKVSEFLGKVSASCKGGDIKGIKALSDFDGAGACLADQSMGFWELLLKNFGKKGWAFKGAQYVSVQAQLAEPGTNEEAIKSEVGPQMRNGHSYERNLPTVGFVTVNYSPGSDGDGSTLVPVGIDSAGDLKFSEWKRSGVQAVSSMPRSPLPPVSSKAATPAQKQVDAFVNALFAALQANDLEACKALFCFDGAPDDLVDQQVNDWKTNNLDDAKRMGATFDKPVFTAREDYLASLGDDRKEAEAELGPKVTNGRTYRPNLPIVGMIGISMKTKGGGSDETGGMPVGIDSSGALKFVINCPEAK